MPIGTPEFYTQLGSALLRPQQWQLYYEPDPFAFIVQNLIAALMMRKGIRQQAIRDFMDWMTRMSPDVAVQWLKFKPFRELIKKQTGLKEKDLQGIERQVEEMLQVEKQAQEVPRQPEQQAPAPYPPFILPEGEPRTAPPMPATVIPAVTIPPEENYITPTATMPPVAPTMGFVPPRGRIPLLFPFPLSFPFPLVLYQV
jgi:hypothetical protein